jgi:hypothetical protein
MSEEEPIKTDKPTRVDLPGDKGDRLKEAPKPVEKKKIKLPWIKRISKDLFSEVTLPRSITNMPPQRWNIPLA